MGCLHDAAELRAHSYVCTPLLTLRSASGPSCAAPASAAASCSSVDCERRMRSAVTDSSPTSMPRCADEGDVGEGEAAAAATVRLCAAPLQVLVVLAVEQWSGRACDG